MSRRMRAASAIASADLSACTEAPAENTCEPRPLPIPLLAPYAQPFCSRSVMFRREVNDPPSTVLNASRAMLSPCLRGGATSAARITVCGVPGLSIRYTTDDCRSEEHTSELQSLMRLSHAVFCLKKKNYHNTPPKKRLVAE